MPSTLTTALAAAMGILNADATFKSYLTGVGGLVIFTDIAPQNAVPDFAILAVQSPGVDTLASPGSFRILTRPLLKFVVTGPASDYANIEAAYARGDALLCPSGGPTKNTAGTLGIYRESPFHLTEPQLVNSEDWIQLGGFYRVIL